MLNEWVRKQASSKKELLMHAAVVRVDLVEGVQLSLGLTAWAHWGQHQRPTEEMALRTERIYRSSHPLSPSYPHLILCLWILWNLPIKILTKTMDTILQSHLPYRCLDPKSYNLSFLPPSYPEDHISQASAPQQWGTKHFQFFKVNKHTLVMHEWTVWFSMSKRGQFKLEFQTLTPARKIY